MTGVLRQIIEAGSARLVVKLARSVPIIGAFVAVGMIGYEVKKKGLIKGVANTVLDATPFVGLAKNMIEIFTGEWISDKPENKALSSASGSAIKPAAHGN